jgi:hypothetical protein
MLKIKVDPDELLKTKGKFRTKNIDPDGCLKTKDLCDNCGKAERLFKSKGVSPDFSPHCSVFCWRAEGRGFAGDGKTPWR